VRKKNQADHTSDGAHDRVAILRSLAAIHTTSPKMTSTSIGGPLSVSRCMLGTWVLSASAYIPIVFASVFVTVEVGRPSSVSGARPVNLACKYRVPY